METETEACAGRCKEAVGLIDMISKQFKRHFPPAEEEPAGGLTNVQRRVLNFILLATIDQEIYQKDVEAEFHIRKSTATGMMQLLEKNGFIRRESVKRDARLKRVVPTEKALALRNGVLEDIRNVEKKMLEGIEPEELEICIRVMNQMSRNLSCGEQDCKAQGFHGREFPKEVRSCTENDNK